MSASLEAASRQITVTFFSDYVAAQKREERLDLATLVARIQNTSQREKKLLPWLKFGRFGDEKTDKGSLRFDANMLAITGVEGDYDGEKLSFEEARQRLVVSGLLAILYTSPSHKPDKPRWRVLCPLSEELPPTERDKLLGRLNGVFDGEFSDESWTLSQSYYYGSVKLNKSHQAVLIDGTPLDKAVGLDAGWTGKRNTRPKVGNGQDHTSGLVDTAALLQAIRGGREYHRPMVRLIGYWATTGTSMMDARAMLLDAMDSVFPPDRDHRWEQRNADIDRCLQDIYGKNAEQRAKKGPLPDEDPRLDVPPPDADPRAELPTIRCEAGKLHILANQAEAALIQAGAEVFQRADSLVRVGLVELPAADKRTTHAAGLYRIDGAALAEELAQVALWERFDMRLGEVVATDPPRKVVEVLAARKGRWHLRSVLGVITAPTLRPDGSILDAPGYDAATRLYYAPDGSLVMPPVKANPTEDDARAALAVFTDLFVEFPFVAEQDKAVGLSLPISAVVRGALGMVPVHAFTAPTPGSGKSFIADLTSTIISGRWCPVIAPGSSTEELEKRLGAMVLAGHSIISLDNASTEISGDALCQIAERPTVRIRILGRSEAPECEFRGILIANGNNLVVSGDMVRRTLLGCLDSGLERPEERKFKGDPVRLILADRGKYISAAITIVRAYLAAGSPGKLSPLASYSEWSDRVRSALVWLGCADPVASMLKLRDSDPVLAALSGVLNAWAAVFGKDQANAKTSQQVATIFANGFDPEGAKGAALTNLRAALAPIASNRVGCIDATKLSYWLRASKLRPASGLKFDSTSVHGGTAAWFVA